MSLFSRIRFSTRAIRILWFVFTLSQIAIALFVFLSKPFQVDTDLRKLAPQAEFNSALQAFINRFNAQTQNKIFIALTGNDFELLEEASFNFEDSLVDSSRFKLHDESLLLSEFVEKLGDKRFYLVTADDRSQLKSVASHEVANLARARLYDANAPIRFLPITKDPLSLTNNYFSELSLRIPGASESESTSGIVLTLEVLGDVLDLGAQAEINSELSTLLNSLAAETDDIEILKTGMFVFAHDAASNSQADIQFISSASIACVTIIILAFFLSFKPLLLSIVTVAMALISGFIICLAIFPRVHVLTLVFGASLIGVAVDYALHYYYFSSGDSYQRHGSKLKSALVFSCCTSVIGYAALCVSDMLALKQVAVLSASGLVSACFFVLAWGNCFRSRKISGASRFVSLSLEMLFARLRQSKKHMTLRRGLSVFFVGASLFSLVAMFGVLFSGSLHTVDDPRSIFKPARALIDDEQKISALKSSFEPASFVQFSANTETALFDQLEKFEAAHPELSMFGVQTLLPSPSERVENFAAHKVLFEGEAPALTFLASLGVEDALIEVLVQDFKSASSEPLNSAELFLSVSQLPLFIAQDEKQSWHAIQLIERGQDTKSIKQIAESFDGADFVDLVDDSKQNLKSLRERASYLLLVSLLTISVIILLRYRRLSELSMMCVPVLSISLTLLALSALGVAITLFHVMALFLVLGLGMDYVIFARDLKHEAAHTLTAISLSAVTSLLSFGLLSVSSFELVSAFGQTVLIGNSMNLVATFVFAVSIQAHSSVNEASYE